MIALKEGFWFPQHDVIAFDVWSKHKLAARDAAAMNIGLRPCLCHLIVQNDQSRPSRNLQHSSLWAQTGLSLLEKRFSAIDVTRHFT
jgi:hypothetical protein